MEAKGVKFKFLQGCTVGSLLALALILGAMSGCAPHSVHSDTREDTFSTGFPFYQPAEFALGPEIPYDLEEFRPKPQVDDALAALPGTENLDRIADNLTRVLHSQELLGKSYQRSVVRHTESLTNIGPFILRKVKTFLPKAYKSQARRITQTILTEAKAFELDPLFLFAVIQTESSFNPKAVGPVGEVGLMQLKETTGDWLAQKNGMRWKGKKTLLDPVQNIRLGAVFLSELRERFDLHGQLYVNAYNMGSRTILRKLDKAEMPKEYSNRVMKRYIAIYQTLKDEAKDHRLLTERNDLAHAAFQPDGEIQLR